MQGTPQQQVASDEYSNCDLRTKIQLLQSKLHPSFIDGKWSFKEANAEGSQANSKQLKTNAKSISDNSDMSSHQQQLQQQQKCLNHARHSHKQSSQNSLDSTSRQSPLDNSLSDNTTSTPSPPVADERDVESVDSLSICSSSSSASSSSTAPTPPPRFSSLQASQRDSSDFRQRTAATRVQVASAANKNQLVAQDGSQQPRFRNLPSLEQRKQVHVSSKIGYKDDNNTTADRAPTTNNNDMMLEQHERSASMNRLQPSLEALTQQHRQLPVNLPAGNPNCGLGGPALPARPLHANQFAPTKTLHQPSDLNAQHNNNIKMASINASIGSNNASNYSSKQTTCYNGPAAGFNPAEPATKTGNSPTSGQQLRRPQRITPAATDQHSLPPLPAQPTCSPPTTSEQRQLGAAPSQVDPEFRVGDAPITKALQLQQQLQQQQATFVINRPSSRHPIRGCMLPPTPAQLQKQQQASQTRLQSSQQYLQPQQLGSISSASMSSISSSTSSSINSSFALQNLHRNLQATHQSHLSPARASGSGNVGLSKFHSQQHLLVPNSRARQETFTNLNRQISPDSVQLLVSDPHNQQQQAGSIAGQETQLMMQQVHQFGRQQQQRAAERCAGLDNNDTTPAIGHDKALDADNNPGEPTSGDDVNGAPDPLGCTTTSTEARQQRTSDSNSNPKKSSPTSSDGIDQQRAAGQAATGASVLPMSRQKQAVALLAINSRIQQAASSSSSTTPQLPTLQQVQLQQKQLQLQLQAVAAQQQRQPQLHRVGGAGQSMAAAQAKANGQNNANGTATAGMSGHCTAEQVAKSLPNGGDDGQQQQLAAPHSASGVSGDAAAGQATTAQPATMEIEQTTAATRNSANTFLIGQQQQQINQSRRQVNLQQQRNNQFATNLNTNSHQPISKPVHQQQILSQKQQPRNLNFHHQPEDVAKQANSFRTIEQQTLLTTADNYRLQHQQSHNYSKNNLPIKLASHPEQPMRSSFNNLKGQVQDPIPAPRVSGSSNFNSTTISPQYGNKVRSPTTARDFKDELSIITGHNSSASSSPTGAMMNNRLKNVSTLAGTILTSPATGCSTPPSSVLGDSAGHLMTDAAASELIPKLIARLDRKLIVLKEEQLTLTREIQLNEATGQRLFESMKRHLTVNEFERITLHANEIEKVTKLILSLRSRLKRFETELKERAAIGSRAPRGNLIQSTQKNSQQSSKQPDSNSNGGSNTIASHRQQQLADSLRLAPTIRGLSDPTSTIGLPKRQHQHHASLQASNQLGTTNGQHGSPTGSPKSANKGTQNVNGSQANSYPNDSSSSSTRNSAVINDCDAIDTKNAANSSSSDSIFNSADSAIGSTINGHGGSISNMESQQQHQQAAASSQSSLTSTGSASSQSPMQSHLSSSISVSSHNSTNSSVPNSPLLVSPATTFATPSTLNAKQVATVQPYSKSSDDSISDEADPSSARGANDSTICHNENNDSMMLALTDFDILIAKRNKLVSQLEEAHHLEECILRRNDIIIEKILKKYYDENAESSEISEFKQFTKLKSLLFKDTHDVADRIDNAEHQLIELRQTNQCNS